MGVGALDDDCQIRNVNHRTHDLLDTLSHSLRADAFESSLPRGRPTCRTQKIADHLQSAKLDNSKDKYQEDGEGEGDFNYRRAATFFAANNAP